MSSSITIHDVAREAGVSINTVSRALNGQTKGMRRDAAERAERILAIAKRLGYQPHAAARALSSQRTGNIGFIMSDRISGLWSNPFWSEQLTGVERACRRHGYSLTIKSYDLSNVDSFIYPQEVGRRSIDGLILTGFICHEVLAKFHEAGIPVVSTSDNTEIAADLVPSFAIDMLRVNRELQEHLYLLGHRRVLETVPNTRVHRMRFEQHQRQADDFGMELLPIFLKDETCDEQAADAICARITAEPSRSCTALISTAQAHLAVRRILSDQGYSLPKDLGQVTTFVWPEKLFPFQQLSGIGMNLQQLGEITCDHLIAYIQEKERPLSRLLGDELEFHFQDFGSCLPVAEMRAG